MLAMRWSLLRSAHGHPTTLRTRTDPSAGAKRLLATHAIKPSNRNPLGAMRRGRASAYTTCCPTDMSPVSCEKISMSGTAGVPGYSVHPGSRFPARIWSTAIDVPRGSQTWAENLERPNPTNAAGGSCR